MSSKKLHERKIENFFLHDEKKSPYSTRKVNFERKNRRNAEYLCGVVWCGVVWCGAVRCGAVRSGAERCGAVRSGAVRCGAVRCGAVRCVMGCGVVV